jgi:hypothetical protein
MKPFKTMAMLQWPRSQVWSTVRDSMPELVPYLDDIESISVQERAAGQDSIQLTNLWRAKAQIPAALSALIRPEMLAWTDRAEWREADYSCHFDIEPHFAKDNISCRGVARYEEAMAGRGTRILFEGTLDVDARGWPAVPSLLAGTISAAAEAFVTALIPRNFLKLGQAVNRYLQAAEAAAAGAPENGLPLHPR